MPQTKTQTEFTQERGGVRKTKNSKISKQCEGKIKILASEVSFFLSMHHVCALQDLHFLYISFIFYSIRRINWNSGHIRWYKSNIFSLFFFRLFFVASLFTSRREFAFFSHGIHCICLNLNSNLKSNCFVKKTQKILKYIYKKSHNIRLNAQFVCS